MALFFLLQSRRDLEAEDTVRRRSLIWPLGGERVLLKILQAAQGTLKGNPRQVFRAGQVL